MTWPIGAPIRSHLKEPWEVESRITAKLLLSALMLTVSLTSLSAAPFAEVSRNFAVLESREGGEYLCAIVNMDGGVFAVASQSLFFDPVPVFRLKAFNTGEVLRQASFEFALQGDFVRVKLDESQVDAGMGLGENPQMVYSITENDGIVYRSEAKGGNLYKDSFRCAPGSPVLDSDGRFVGVASRTDDGIGEIELAAAVLGSDVKWQAASPQSFAKQAFLLRELRDLYKALSHAHRHSGINRFIEIDANSHRQLLPWLKDQNVKALANSLAKPTREDAMREHRARCLHYTNLRRLAVFFSSSAISVRQGRWPSEYLKENAQKVFDLHDKATQKIQAELKVMLERHPSVKEI